MGGSPTRAGVLDVPKTGVIVTGLPASGKSTVGSSRGAGSSKHLGSSRRSSPASSNASGDESEGSEIISDESLPTESEEEVNLGITPLPQFFNIYIDLL